MAKIIIDIPDEDYKELIKDKDFILRTKNPWKIAIVNDKALSDGATNGEVIKTLFPKLHMYSDFYYWKVDLGEIVVGFDKKWWNSPYKE